MSHNSIGEDSAFPKMFDHAKYRYQDKNNHKILSQPNDPRGIQINYQETIAHRPMTSNAFRVPYNLSDPIGATHYDTQFYPKSIKREEPIRTATASGTRSNKPHPSKEFMIYRFKPLKLTENSENDWSKQIGNELIAQAIRNQMRSTYSTDYINNVEEKQKFEERARQKMYLSNSSYNLDSTKNKQQNPDRLQSTYSHDYEDLNSKPGRYVSNRRHQEAAVGIVPECSKFWHDLNI